jgi:hypothetical protein
MVVRFCKGITRDDEHSTHLARSVYVIGPMPLSQATPLPQKHRQWLLKAATSHAAGLTARTGAQYASPLTISPPAIVPSALQVIPSTDDLTNRTPPSPKSAFTPPGW